MPVVQGPQQGQAPRQPNPLVAALMGGRGATPQPAAPQLNIGTPGVPPPPRQQPQAPGAQQNYMLAESIRGMGEKFGDRMSEERQKAYAEEQRHKVAKEAEQGTNYANAQAAYHQLRLARERDWPARKAEMVSLLVAENAARVTAGQPGFTAEEITAKAGELTEKYFPHSYHDMSDLEKIKARYGISPEVDTLRGGFFRETAMAAPRLDTLDELAAASGDDLGGLRHHGYLGQDTLSEMQSFDDLLSMMVKQNTSEVTKQRAYEILKLVEADIGEIPGEFLDIMSTQMSNVFGIDLSTPELIENFMKSPDEAKTILTQANAFGQDLYETLDRNPKIAASLLKGNYRDPEVQEVIDGVLSRGLERLFKPMDPKGGEPGHIGALAFDLLDGPVEDLHPAHAHALGEMMLVFGTTMQNRSTEFLKSPSAKAAGQLLWGSAETDRAYQAAMAGISGEMIAAGTYSGFKRMVSSARSEYMKEVIYPLVLGGELGSVKEFNEFAIDQMAQAREKYLPGAWSLENLPALTEAFKYELKGYEPAEDVPSEVWGSPPSADQEASDIPLGPAPAEQRAPLPSQRRPPSIQMGLPQPQPTPRSQPQPQAQGGTPAAPKKTTKPAAKKEESGKGLDPNKMSMLLQLLEALA